MAEIKALSGCLYIIGTPIGNLSDISERVKATFAEVDLLLCEDTRVTQKLLFHLGLNKPMKSCHDHNETQRLSLLTELNREGKKVGLVSDAGMPLVSDPGYRMVRHAIDIGMRLEVIPGPTALSVALVASGLPCERFVFEGFLPDKKGERERRLQSLKMDERTLVFYVSPHRLSNLISEIHAVFGFRRACLARELTKHFEEFRRLDLANLLRDLEREPARGECVLIVEGCSQEVFQRLSPAEVKGKLLGLLEQGARLKEASSVLAPECGWSVSEIYKLGLILQDESSLESNSD